MKSSRFVTASEAARILDVSLATLYAYVSRGLIRSEPGSEGKRSRTYSREDVQRLVERKSLRKQPMKAVAEALHWGTPSHDSAITLIADGRCYYRGHDVVRLAAQRTFEEVAALIWGDGVPADRGDLWRTPPEIQADVRKIARLVAERPAVERFQVLLPLLAGHDPAAYDLRPAATARTGARIVMAMTMIAADMEWRGSVAGTLQQAWSPRRPKSRELYEAALILCADHELNVSAFTVRCIASAGSTLYASIDGGISAALGFKHGGHTKRVDALLQEIGLAARARQVVSERLSRGETIPGFGHPLYPEGDPRSRALLERIEGARIGAGSVGFTRDVAAEVGELIREHPTIDYALVALVRALGIPAEHALTLFTLGRTAGWIGHAIEEYAGNRIIRPRARYTGVEPVREEE